MLDFYLLKDHLPKPKSFSTKEHVGGLEYDEFENLKKLGIIEQHLDYYADFRWGLQDVERKLKMISEVAKDKRDIEIEIKEIQDILILAFNSNSGLLAIGD